MRIAVLSLVVVAAVAILAAITQRGGEAAWPGENGDILYNDANNPGIWSMDPGGGNRMQLTGAEGDYYANWSPDASKIVFQRGFSASAEIWTMDPDGHNAQMIAPGISPSWSNDGSRIVFSRGGLIMEMGAGGGNEETLTQDAGVFDAFPVYQPGGDLIAFLRGPLIARAAISGGVGNPTNDIYLMNPDGTVDAVTETTGYYEGWPDWSPDGNKLVFRGNGGISTWTLGSKDPPHVIHPYDGSFIDAPSWSPDGTMIAFSKGPAVSFLAGGSVPQGAPAENAEIWIMGANGEDPHVVPGSLPDPLEFSPDWGPALPAGTPRIWGDVDCDGEVTTRDNQAKLRFVLKQEPLSQTEPCPDIGSEVMLR